MAAATNNPKGTTNRDRVLDLMSYHGTDSPTRIMRLLKKEYGISIAASSVSRHLKIIKDESASFYQLIAKSLYAVNAHADYERVNRLIKMQEANIKLIPEGDQDALDQATANLKVLHDMRDYIQEDKVLMTPAIRKRIENEITTDQQKERQVPAVSR